MSSEEKKQAAPPPPEPGKAPVTSESPPREQRPTLVPPFDMAEFARESTGPDTGTPDAINWKLSELVPRNDRAPQFEGTSGEFHEADTAKMSPAPPSSNTPTMREPSSQPHATLPIPESSHPGWSAPPLSVSTEERTAPRAIRVPETTNAPVPALASATNKSAEMHDRFALGDFQGALTLAETLLANDKDDLAARDCADKCRSALQRMYASQLGPLNRTPTVAVPHHQLRWLSIDHRAGFVLSLVDGISNLETIIDMSGMPQLDTLRILYELVQQKVITFKS